MSSALTASSLAAHFWYHLCRTCSIGWMVRGYRKSSSSSADIAMSSSKSETKHTIRYVEKGVYCFIGEGNSGSGDKRRSKSHPWLPSLAKTAHQQPARKATSKRAERWRFLCRFHQQANNAMRDAKKAHREGVFPASVLSTVRKQVPGARVLIDRNIMACHTCIIYARSTRLA